MNTFGRSFRVTTFGESHGVAVGVVVDGCPADIPFTEDDVQPLLDRRRPGTSPLSSPRREPDRVTILSGVFEGRTTGAPIAMLVCNRDIRSGDYDELASVFRPGHADWGWHAKFGMRDYRGGGRSSGRETLGRVCAGALAMKLLGMKGIGISGRAVEIAGKSVPAAMEQAILEAKAEGDSVGGIVEVAASGCPAGLGDPVFSKLDAAIAAAMMGIGAVKGVEIGTGFAAARMRGSEHNDRISAEGFLSNNAGGILGGISTGADIVVKIAVKPTASIAVPQKTVDTAGHERTITVRGRHDPCIVPRIIPVAESMLALVLIDAFLEQQKYSSFLSVLHARRSEG